MTDTNPYAVEQPEGVTSLDAVSARNARATAKRLAAGGAAVGSIAKKLQSIGLDQSSANEFAKDALIARSRIERIVGILLVAFGCALLFAGYALSYYFVRRIPVYVAMAGAFVLMIGCVKLFHRNKFAPPKPRSGRIT